MKLFNKSISILLTLIFIFGLLSINVFAQPNSLPNNIKGFNGSVFDSHFSKADREINPERWLFEAKLGITQAIYAWELIAGNLYENPLLFEEAKNKVINWSNEELEERFSQWLMGRFFGEAAEKSLMVFSEMIGETQKNYTWQLDNEGNIIFDGKTGDPLLIRLDDNIKFSSDLLMWRDETENIITTNNNHFDTVMTGLYTELLTYIPNELRETMSAVIKKTGANITGTIKREFENIAAREESIFTSRRTRDIQSLRKKSDDEAARIFTQKLIAETEDVCARGIEDLTVRIEEASAGIGDLALLGEEWLRLYKEQFDRGLKAWEEAEQRFFVRRIEWEQESFRLFSEGEEKWLAAFNQFEEERRKWELKAKELFESGERMFKSISEEFEKNITEAKHEFEINMAMRIGEGTTKVKALIDMYLICSSAAISAMENIQYWQSQYKSSSIPDPKSSAFSSWLLQEERENKNSSLAEIRKTYDLYVSYMEKALDARDRLLANYAELIGTGALKDILSPNASSEDFCLDEYQVALIRAKALVLYWEQKTIIAEAVMGYANDLSAGRMTETEGIRAWENAKTAYNTSLALYETELNKLTLLGEEIQKQQAVLQTIAQRLLSEEEKLNELNSEYGAFLNASIINRGDYYLIDLNQIYNYLENEYKLFLLKGTEAEYGTILENGMKWDIAERRETAEIVLDMLINGLGDDLPSLDELKKVVSEGNNSGGESEINLIIRLAGIDLFADNGQLRALNSTYSGADWYSKVKGISLTNNEKAALYGVKLNERLAADYENSSQILFEKRFELELNLLINILIIEPDDDNFSLLEFQSLDQETAAYVYEVLFALKERIDAGEPYYTENNDENKIIDKFLSGNSFFTGYEQYLAEYYNEYYLCKGLYDLYYEYAILSSFSQKELWQDTCNSLTKLFGEYGINQSSGFIPNPQSITNSILKKGGDFVFNAAQFLLEFDKCFLTIPQWLEYEISFWKNSLVEYIAAAAFYDDIKPDNINEKLAVKQKEIETKYDELFNYADSLIYIDDDEIDKINRGFSEIYNEISILQYAEQINQAWETIIRAANVNENEKHWRQFITDDYLTNDEMFINAAFSWKEGVLKDALFSADYYSNKLNDSFTLSRSKVEPFNENSDYYSSLYLEKSSALINRFNSLSLLFNEIANAGKSFELIQTPVNILETRLKTSYEALKAQEIIYNKIKDEYFREAEKFLNTGLLYDKQYGILKKAHENTDQKRFEYEKQDAIQRWASTAYIGADKIDPEECYSKLSKAQTVLTVLSDLYNGETRRAYEGPEYNALYTEYEKSFTKKIKVLEAIEVLISATAQEQTNNQKIYSEFQKTLQQLGNVNTDYQNYTSPASFSEWSIKDIITIKDGLLAFSRDNSETLTGVNEKKAEELDKYFNAAGPEGERNNISNFEDALRGLSQRLADHLNNFDKFRTWSLARDYLILSLKNSNTGLSFLNNYYSGVGLLSSDGPLGSLLMKTGVFKSPNDLYSGLNINAQYGASELAGRNAWNSLSEEEKADLEFYVILTLSDNGYSAGFSQMFAVDLYTMAYKEVDGYYQHAKKQIDTAWKLLWSWLYYEMRDLNHNTLKRISPVITQTNAQINSWISGLNSNLSSINNYSLLYTESCKKLDTLEGKKSDGTNITWNDISAVLLATGKINSLDINGLRVSWELFSSESGMLYQDVSGALAGLLGWARNSEEKNKIALEKLWKHDSQIQQINDNNFHFTAEEYIAGNINLETLKTNAKSAYGKNTASWKNHYDNLLTIMFKDISTYVNLNFNFFSEFNVIGNEIVTSTEQILQNEYKAELFVREIEWDITLRDIKEKYNDWLDSAALIFENGRADWNANVLKMEEAYKQWKINFQNEYTRISDEWAQAYLAGLEDKENWLEQAAAAANQASADSFLSLIGTEGERLSRFIDTREPFGIRNSVPQTDSLIAELLQSAGIANMYSAFGSINNASIASPLVKRGLGGSSWDASLTKIAALDLSQKTNTEIADRESRMLAHNVQLAIDEAIKNLTANVGSANKSFQNSMDNMFILNGLWRKNGNNYVKNIVKGSTLLTPVISEMTTIAGYVNYKMQPVSLKTNIDEKNLEYLDSIAIRGLLENAYLEIETITAEIFGIGLEAIKIKKHSDTEKREQSPGKFGVHIGYSPDIKPGNEFGTTKNSIFYDEGAGELGRLLTEYYYWNIIDTKGSAELALAPWDKRIWNDENSFFSAPTLRSIGQVSCTIASAAVAAAGVAASPFTGGASAAAGIGLLALSVGINSSDDLLFNSLDAGYGYKTIGEAGFDFGKALLINSASAAISGAFGGLGESIGGIAGAGLTKTAVNAVSGTAGKIAVQTAMTGLQPVTSYLATNALSAVTYNSADGFGWSKETFSADMRSMLTSTASSMVSTFTTQSLQAINTGIIADKITEKFGGFNSGNYNDITKLNGLLGSLAGQGVSYAMGDDFTLNVLNLSLLSGNKYNRGLLELNLGRNGPSINIGTGGANVSFDNLASALRGAQVWNVSSQINSFVKNEKDFDSAFTLRGQYGYGDDVHKDQLWDILMGDATLRTTAGGDFDAQTIFEDGKRVINLTGYQLGMNMEEQMRLAVILGHEAYRDGFVTDDNYLETRTAALSHTEMVIRMLSGGQQIALDENLIKDIVAYSMGEDFFNAYVDANYDSYADYWKLTREGSLEYDGFATLRDADGNIINSYGEMGLSSDNSIEGALLWLLNIDKNNSANVAAVRNLMVKSGIKHSFDYDSENWLWRGEQDVLVGAKGSFPLTNKVNLTEANMGKTIGINAIAELFTNIGASGNNTSTSINRIYGSAIGFLNYANTGGTTIIADSTLLNYYTSAQLGMVKANQNWLNNALTNGVNINRMVSGNPDRTSEFDRYYEEKLKTSSVEGAVFFTEQHTGIDYGGGGTSIQTPGGYWELIVKDSHKAYFQLYGSDVKMRIQHLDPNDLNNIALNTLFGGINNNIISYPTESFGSGTGAHIHIDITMNLPYNEVYRRQFVNPETLLPGSRLNYQFSYKDAAKNNLPNYPSYFNRY